METFTITFGDLADNDYNEAGKIGKKAIYGLNYNDLAHTKEAFENKGCACEILDVTSALDSCRDSLSLMIPKAHLLVVRNGANVILKQIGKDSKTIGQELRNLKWEKQTFNKDKNKFAQRKSHHHLCFGDEDREPDLKNGKTSVVNFNQIPCINYIRSQLSAFAGQKADMLVAEGNRYTDVLESGIGFHTDKERKIVIAIRSGTRMALCYHWFHNCQPIGKSIIVYLNDGDMYFMSENAVGSGFKRDSKLILKHAAGCPKYVTPKGDKIENNSNGKRLKLSTNQLSITDCYKRT
jgi:hypothetical protein